jgi:hypothetical protein
MALVKTSALISDIKGRLSGSVFQGSASGLTIRTERKHINRRTVFQTDQRAIAQLVQSAWQALSDNDRTSWNVYAGMRNKPQRKNPMVKLSGHQIFLNENIIRLSLSARLTTPLTIITTPIIQTQPAQVNINSVTIPVGGVLLITKDIATVEGDNFFAIYITRPLTKSQLSQHNKFQLMKVLQDSEDHVDVAASYIAKFGSLPPIGSFVNTKICQGLYASNGLSNITESRFEVS